MGIEGDGKRRSSSYHDKNKDLKRRRTSPEADVKTGTKRSAPDGGQASGVDLQAQIKTLFSHYNALEAGADGESDLTAFQAILGSVQSGWCLSRP